MRPARALLLAALLLAPAACAGGSVAILDAPPRLLALLRGTRT